MDENRSDKFSWKPGDVVIHFPKKKNDEEQEKQEEVHTMDKEKYILMTIDNRTWSPDFTVFDDIVTARAAMKKDFDRDLENALDTMCISHPKEIVYTDYSEQFFVMETEDSLHAEFLSDVFSDDVIHYEIKALSEMESE